MSEWLRGWCGNVPGAPLTERQRAVHALIRRGMTNKQIARALGLEVPTIKHHVACVLVRLGVENRTQAATREVA